MFSGSRGWKATVLQQTVPSSGGRANRSEEKQHIQFYAMKEYTQIVRYNRIHEYNHIETVLRKMSACKRISYITPRSGIKHLSGMKTNVKGQFTHNNQLNKNIKNIYILLLEGEISAIAPVQWRLM